MAVTGFTFNRDYRQGFAARRSSLSLSDKQQVSIFNGSNRPKLPRKPHQKTGIAFISLIHMVQHSVRHTFVQRWLEVLSGRYFLHNFPHRCLVP